MLGASLALGLALLPCQATLGQDLARELSEPHLGTNEVTRAGWSPDGSTLVYIADMDLEDKWEIHSVSAAGGEPTVLATNLSGPSFAISQDSSTVVYRSAFDPELALGVFAVPIGGGPSVPLHAGLEPSGYVSSAVLTSDDRALYVAAPTDEAYGDLFATPISGGAPIRLSQENTDLWRISCFLPTEDESRVVYCRNRGQSEHLEIYSVPSSGGTPVQLVSSPAPSGRIFGLKLSPDGTRVIYRVRHDATFGELYSVPTDGSASPVQISNVPGVGVGGSYWITSDSQTVVYEGTVSSTRRVLHSVPIGGGAITVLRDMATDPAFRNTTLAESSDTVLFISARHLQTLPATGGVASPISTLNTAGGFVQEYRLDPAENRVVYRADGTQEGRYDLYGVAVAGGPVVQLNDPAVDPEGIQGWFDYLASSSHAFFERSGRIAATPLDGGSDVVLSRPLPAGAEIGFLYPSPAGDRLAYLSSEESSAAVDLYAADADGGEVLRLSQDSRQLAGRAERFLLSPDGRYAAFLADRDTKDHYELFVSSIADGTVVKLNPPLDFGREVGADFAFTSDSSRVLFRIESEYRFWDLWAAILPETLAGAAPNHLGPEHGGASTEKGTGEVVRYLLDDSESSVVSFRLLSDGNQLRFLADGDLRRIFVQGGPSQVVGGFEGAISKLWITPDESTLVFEGLEPGSNTERLFAMPVDGGPEVLLSSGGSASSTFSRVEFTADSQWVLYVFSNSSIIRTVSIDGQTSAIPGFGSSSAVLTPDSQYILARDSFDLVRYPMGSDEGTTLLDSATLGMRVQDFVLAADGNIVASLYTPSGGPWTLVSVPLAGGDPIQLHLEEEGVIPDLHVSSSGDQIFFEVGESFVGDFVLHTVAATGGPSRPLTGGAEAHFLGTSSEAPWVFYYPGQNGPSPELYAEHWGTGARSLLVPADFTAEVQSDLIYSPMHDAVFFRAEHHDLRTGLHTSTIDFDLLIDGFESGDTTAWSNGS